MCHASQYPCLRHNGTLPGQRTALEGKRVALGGGAGGTPFSFTIGICCPPPTNELLRITGAGGDAGADISEPSAARTEPLHRDNMWQPTTERLQHFQTMLKSKLNVLTLKKDPVPTVVFHEPEDIELRSTTPLAKNRAAPTGYKVAYLGKVTVSGTQFLSGCTESAVAGLWEGRARANPPSQADALLEIRPSQVRLLPLEEREGGASSFAAETHQVSRIAYCTADHAVSPNVFAWIYRQINDDLSFQMDCHAVECASKMEAKRLAHAMMEAFRLTLQRMHSEGRILSPPAPEDSAHPDSAPSDG
ncbi:hypothetical protein GJAV_G00123490 [Gymnothorax javanicus]|nr:hypothetical protein GJAV_G00123490 [Gymnothorax javanicus]